MKHIKIICIFFILVSILSCSKQNTKTEEQRQDSTRDITKQDTHSETDNNGDMDTGEYTSIGAGENGFYPDIDFYTTLSLFKEYLDALNQRTPYSFSFNVPGEVKNETVEFSSLVSETSSIPGNTDMCAIVTTEDVIMYEKPFTASPTITRLNRGDVFTYNYTWDFPVDPEKLTDMNQMINIAQFNSDVFLGSGDLKGLYVNELFNNWHYISNENISGWVFGAYLHLDDMENVLLMRELYLRGSVFPAYQDYYVAGRAGTNMSNEYQFNMYKKKFSPALQEKLKTQFMALEKVSPSEIYVSVDNPDDMVLLYKKLCAGRMNPVLITTDFILHILHILFDRALQDIEVTYLLSYYKNKMLISC